MGDVKVIVVTGNVRREFMFPQIPSRGDQIKLGIQVYNVRKVLHTPESADYAAEITAELNGEPKY